MTDGPELPSIYLRPGEIAIVREPTLISTILGSCVSFTFHHPARLLAGMCHALLPHGNGDRGLRYVDSSGRHLLEAFLRLGIRREEIVVKLFGGADMFEPRGEGLPPSVGAQNVAAAKAFLEEEGLRLRSSDVGGRRGRKILFHTATGDVLLRRLNRQEIPHDCAG